MKASCFRVVFLLPFFLRLGPVAAGSHGYCGPVPATDAELIHVAMNLEFLEAEFFLYGALGRGLDGIAPHLALGGPPPAGGERANLDPLVRRIIEEFGYEEVGHLRAIYTTVGGIQRPLIDISAHKFAMMVDEALGHRLWPPFDPYLDTVNYLLASYLIPYVGLTGYVGVIPNLSNFTTKALVAGLLGVESGQDAVIRTLLYERALEKVAPYDITVAEFTNLFSILRNKLGMCGIKDEGIVVPPVLGAEQRTETNVLSANKMSLSYPRTPQEVLRVVYGTGDEHVPGGFFPNGANGEIARRFLEKKG
ncbi:desiccation-related protein PCC13-62-like [Rhodamnia argentea]|uniref:Desiccation-related protein PCC13-62-like n=1 Tax=Rhodamnia argentea TaxID=178133 RepID=A0A8B8Q899_9MYRT|nr:desiccation-related protein PCC13-62-like [Rhodamnia argentea]XP_048134891.1 desiccation-related protein PCC13-62-like [Rhodamnia argentea]XP_048134894.1 desiccation-related protein PCC13-62-like [Rhodamnia argentea]